jgi:hypothetical protein
MSERYLVFEANGVPYLVSTNNCAQSVCKDGSGILDVVYIGKEKLITNHIFTYTDYDSAKEQFLIRKGTWRHGISPKV